MAKDKRADSQSPRRGRLKVLIVLLGVVAPFCTDMCLPALPTIASDLAVSYTEANVIILIFFLFMALSMLLVGPLSDAFGRKPVLLVCLTIFALGNLLCTLANTIVLLCLFRAVSACGAGGMMSASTALVKDGFEEGEPRDRALAVVQSFHVIGPLLAPVLGALLLSLFGWHSSFILLALIGVIGFVLALVEPVVADTPMSGRPAQVLGRAFSHIPPIIKTPSLMFVLVVAGLVQACFMAYLATSSYIYTVQFGLSETVYSLFFACSALFAMLGPRLFLVLQRNIFPRFVYGGCIVLIVIAGVLIATVGHLNPIAFFCCFLVVAVCNSICRPLGISVMLRQHEGDTGTLSAVINFGIYVIALLGMTIGSLPTTDFVSTLGITIIGFGSVALIAFVTLMKSSIYVKGFSSELKYPGKASSDDDANA